MCVMGSRRLSGISTHVAATSSGATGSYVGGPALSVMTQSGLASLEAMTASNSNSIPITTDADTGFGGPLNLACNIQPYKH